MIFQDSAIIVSWPETTIRGDESWMMFFKKIGIVKNLNFVVGHTGVILVCHKTGDILYYDFGRYITSRKNGRARSKDSDPRLELPIKAEFTAHGQIANLEAISVLLETKKDAVQGYGKLYFSVAYGVNFQKAKLYGDNLVREGSMSYGAVAKGSNNCSRFITRLLIHSSKKYTTFHSINLPETIKASPMSNVVNAVRDRMIYSFSEDEGLVNFKMNRWESFRFLCKMLYTNLHSGLASRLPDDRVIGETRSLRPRHPSVPEGSQYLGGIGEGAWFSISEIDQGHFKIERFTTFGELEYAVNATCPDLDLRSEYQVTYDSHRLFTHVLQNGIKMRLEHISPYKRQKVLESQEMEVAF